MLSEVRLAAKVDSRGTPRIGNGRPAPTIGWKGYTGTSVIAGVGSYERKEVIMTLVDCVWTRSKHLWKLDDVSGFG